MDFQTIFIIVIIVFFNLLLLNIFRLQNEIYNLKSTDKSLPGLLNENMNNFKNVDSNSDVNKKLNWYFKPLQRSIETKIGDSVLAYYKVKNNSEKSISGVATYNILPFEAGQYFNKVDCFCFENQILGPGEEVVLPVNFYIDPKILEDPKIKHLNSVVLSYTFFKSDENLDKIKVN